MQDEHGVIRVEFLARAQKEREQEKQLQSRVDALWAAVSDKEKTRLQSVVAAEVKKVLHVDSPGVTLRVIKHALTTIAADDNAYQKAIKFSAQKPAAYNKAIAELVADSATKKTIIDVVTGTSHAR